MKCQKKHQFKNAAQKKYNPLWTNNRRAFEDIYKIWLHQRNLKEDFRIVMELSGANHRTFLIDIYYFLGYICPYNIFPINICLSDICSGDTCFVQVAVSKELLIRS